jgi:hypothetical protein
MQKSEGEKQDTECHRHASEEGARKADALDGVTSAPLFAVFFLYVIATLGKACHLWPPPPFSSGACGQKL